MSASGAPQLRFGQDYSVPEHGGWCRKPGGLAELREWLHEPVDIESSTGLIEPRRPRCGALLEPVVDDAREEGVEAGVLGAGRWCDDKGDTDVCGRLGKVIRKLEDLPERGSLIRGAQVVGHVERGLPGGASPSGQHREPVEEDLEMALTTPR